MDNRAKITTGLNDRPLNETIAQTGGGLPDDSGLPIEVDQSEIERIRAKLEGDKGSAADEEHDPGEATEQGAT